MRGGNKVANKSWLTVGKISGYCMVSEATVRRWIKSSILCAIRLPSGHYRVTIEDFRDFLERNNMPIEGVLFESESKKKGGKQ